MSLETMDTAKIEESWNLIKQDIRRRWPDLNQDDLNLIDGDSQKLVALVHQKTGASLHAIEEGIDEVAQMSHGTVESRVPFNSRGHRKYRQSCEGTFGPDSRSSSTDRQRSSVSNAWHRIGSRIVGRPCDCRIESACGTGADRLPILATVVSFRQDFNGKTHRERYS